MKISNLGCLIAVLLAGCDQIEEQILKHTTWEYTETVDKTSGDVTGSISAYSLNELNGAKKNGQVLLGITCPHNMWARPDRNWLQMHDHECGIKDLGCRHIQETRIGFDGNAPSMYKFDIQQENFWVMRLSSKSSMPSEHYSKDNLEYAVIALQAIMSWNKKIEDVNIKLIGEMQNANKMQLELTLAHTDGISQISEFDLEGFSQSYRLCSAKN